MSTTEQRSPRCALSIDLEDWFHVANMRHVIDAASWPARESRVVAATERLLRLFDDAGCRATFFVLGWVAERHPALIERIASDGHEIGSHTYAHRMLTEQSPTEFADDLARSLRVLRDIVGDRPMGFRAPSFTVTRATAWATTILRDAGIVYDSSVQPIGGHPDYGIPDAPLDPYRHPDGLLEIPMTVATVGNVRLPCSGGGYFRLLPAPVFDGLVARAMAQGRRLVFYLHPWEIDPGQPRVAMSATRRLRHYANLARTEDRLARLLARHRFAPMHEVFADEIAGRRPVPTA